MPKPEKRFLAFIQRHIFVIYVLVAAYAAILLRLLLFESSSADLEMFLLPWYEEIARGGYASIANHSADYNIAYLTLLYLATKLPMAPAAAVKTLMTLGDCLLGFAATLVVYQSAGQNKKKAALAFTVVMLLPLGILNSAYWGQSDSIYTAFLLLAVWALLQEKWPLAFVFFGLALCFKLQAIFFLPALLILYACRRAFSLLWFLVPPAILFLSGLPLVFVGGSPLRVFEIYLGQVEGSRGVFVNYHNISSFFRGQSFDVLGRFLVLATVLALFTLLCLCLYRNLRPAGDSLVLLCALCIYACALFLPGMHERYAYAAEVLLVLWCFGGPKPARLVPTGVAYLIGFMASSRFLFGVWPEASPFIGLANLLNWLWLCRMLLAPQRSISKNCTE